MGIRNILKTITQAMCEVIRGVNFPFVVCSVVRGIEDPVRDEVPHHRIPRIEVLFHPKNRLARFIATVLHSLKLGQGLGDRPCAMATCFTGATFFATPVCFDLLA